LRPNGIHHLLVFAVDVILLDDNINTVNRNTEALIDIVKEVGQEVNTEKTKCMLSHHQNAGKNHYIKVANRSFEVGQAQIFGNDSKKSNFDS
jgi:hypothetical protein